MIYLNGRYYVEVKDKRYTIHPFCDIFSQQCDPAKSLRTEYQVQNINQIGLSQKGFRNQNNELEVKRYPKTKNKKTFENTKFNLPDCLSCRQVNGLNSLMLINVKVVNLILTNKNTI